ncbi:MAG: FHA domain-containing protein [Planctomycetes bacterium]|nr:FHA domain-containing protein [Planctomycetota bacterium]
MSARLLLLTGESAPEEIAVPDRQITIGRSSKCDVIIKSQGVSRQHFAIEKRADGWFLTDLGSKNGVAVDGDRVINAKKVEHGATITFGTVSYRFANISAESSRFHASSAIKYSETDEVLQRVSEPATAPADETAMELDLEFPVDEPLAPDDPDKTALRTEHQAEALEEEISLDFEDADTPADEFARPALAPEETAADMLPQKSPVLIEESSLEFEDDSLLVFDAGSKDTEVPLPAVSLPSDSAMKSSNRLPAAKPAPAIESPTPDKPIVLRAKLPETNEKPRVEVTTPGPDEDGSPALPQPTDEPSARGALAQTWKATPAAARFVIAALLLLSVIELASLLGVTALLLGSKDEDAQKSAELPDDPTLISRMLVGRYEGNELETIANTIAPARPESGNQNRAGSEAAADLDPDYYLYRVQPLVEMHCGDSSCHGGEGSNAPDFSVRRPGVNLNQFEIQRNVDLVKIHLKPEDPAASPFLRIFEGGAVRGSVHGGVQGVGRNSTEYHLLRAFVFGSKLQNSPPRASIMAPVEIELGDTLTLIGGAQDEDRNQPAPSFSFRIHEPAGFSPEGVDLGLPVVSFTPTTTGSYLFELRVSDGRDTSLPCYHRVNVIGRRIPVPERGTDVPPVDSGSASAPPAQNGGADVSSANSGSAGVPPAQNGGTDVPSVETHEQDASATTPATQPKPKLTLNAPAFVSAGQGATIELLVEGDFEDFYLQWTLDEKPEGSISILEPTRGGATIIPDFPGAYKFSVFAASEDQRTEPVSATIVADPAQLTDSTILWLRRLSYKLFDRPPMTQDYEILGGIGRDRYLAKLIRNEEIYRLWYESTLARFAMVGNFRPSNAELADVPARLASRAISEPEVVAILVRHPMFEALHPDPDDFCKTLFEEVLGKSASRMAREIHAATSMIEGKTAVLFGDRGESIDDLLTIVIKQPDFKTRLALLAFSHLVGSELPAAKLPEVQAVVASAPGALPELMTEFALGSEFFASLTTSVPKTPELFIRGLYVDAMDRLPTAEEFTSSMMLYNSVQNDPGSSRREVVTAVLSNRAVTMRQTSGPGAERELRLIYIRLTGKNPTTEKLAEIKSKVETGRGFVRELIEELALAPEYQAY